MLVQNVVSHGGGTVMVAGGNLTVNSGITKLTKTMKKVLRAADWQLEEGMASAAVIYPENVDQGWDYVLVTTMGKAYEVRHEIHINQGIKLTDMLVVRLMDLDES